jgi:hypothetical protein
MLNELTSEELNTLVAEKVMGYTIDHSTVDYDGLRMRCEVWHREGKTFNPAPYSTDLKAAWSVAEEITSPQPPLPGEVVPPNTRFLLWFQSIAREFICSTEQDAARQICVCALIAMGEKP